MARMASVLERISYIIDVLLWTPAAAHDIPEQIVLRGFIKPEGDRLHFLLRVPLSVPLGMSLPQRGVGYLDLPHVDDKLLALYRGVASGNKVDLENCGGRKPG